MMSSPVRSFRASPRSCPIPPSLRCPYASASPESDELAARRGRALGDRHHRVARRVRALVGHEELGEPVDVEWDLRDDGPVDAGKVGGDEACLAAVPAEELDDRDALVAPGARAEVVDELDAAGDGRREADAVVGAVDVVVHRLRDRDDRHTLVVEAERVRERVVPADRSNTVVTEPVDHNVLPTISRTCTPRRGAPASTSIGCSTACARESAPIASSPTSRTLWRVRSFPRPPCSSTAGASQPTSRPPRSGRRLRARLAGESGTRHFEPVESKLNHPVCVTTTHTVRAHTPGVCNCQRTRFT